MWVKLVLQPVIGCLYCCNSCASCLLLSFIICNAHFQNCFALYLYIIYFSSAWHKLLPHIPYLFHCFWLACIFYLLPCIYLSARISLSVSLSPQSPLPLPLSPLSHSLSPLSPSLASPRSPLGTHTNTGHTNTYLCSCDFWLELSFVSSPDIPLDSVQSEDEDKGGTSDLETGNLEQLKWFLFRVLPWYNLHCSPSV